MSYCFGMDETDYVPMTDEEKKAKKKARKKAKKEAKKEAKRRRMYDSIAMSSRAADYLINQTVEENIVHKHNRENLLH